MRITETKYMRNDRNPKKTCTTTNILGGEPGLRIKFVLQQHCIGRGCLSWSCKDDKVKIYVI
jgi:hypothetical protein